MGCLGIHNSICPKDQLLPWSPPMTIIIGASCENGKNGIAIADRMLTAGDLSMAFEHDVPKINRLCTSCVALTAGSALSPADMLRDVRLGLVEKRSPVVSDVLKCVKEKFLQVRNQKLEEELFKPRGLTIEEFRRNQQTLDQTVVLRLDRALEEYELDLHIVLVGVDSYGAHIYYIFNPGSSETFSQIGFCSLGTGERHADTVFVTNKYTPTFSLRKALAIGYEAKKRAEMASGVGRETDIAIMNESGISMVTKDGMAALDKIYNRKIEGTASINKELEQEILSMKTEEMFERG